MVAEAPGYRKSLHSEIWWQERRKVYKERHLLKYPWLRSYGCARDRCSKNGKYAKLGIRFLLTQDQVKTLWFRDGAERMEKPSLDRIDSRSHYKLDNCQFIEHRKNSSKREYANIQGGGFRGQRTFC